MIRRLNLVRVQLKYLSLIKDPTNTQKIFEMIELSQKLPQDIDQIEYFEEQFFKDQNLKNLWKEKYLPDMELRNPENYISFQEGTLGRSYYLHMKKYSLDYRLFPKIEIKIPMDYINQRMYATHDLWHALLGYGSDAVGEIEVQSFTMAQMGSPFNALLISGGMINLIQTQPRIVGDCFERMVAAYQRGKNMKPLAGVKLEEQMDRQVAEIINEQRLVE